MKKIGTKILETENLILRKIELEDYKAAYKNWCSDPLVAKHVTWDAHENDNVTKEIFEMWVKEYEKPTTLRWIAVEKITNTPIGTIDVVNFSERDSRAEIGYCYGKNWWGKGYGTEALKAVIDYLFNEVEFEMIVAKHEISNPASGRCMEKSGMAYCGILPKWTINKEGKREDLKQYMILKNQ